MYETVVSDNIAFYDRSEFFEQLAHLRCLCIICQIPDENFRRWCSRRFSTLGCLAFDRLPVDHVAVQILNRIATLVFALHVDKTVILDDVAFHNFAVFLEKWSNIGGVSFLGEIPDEYFECARTAKTRHG